MNVKSESIDNFFNNIKTMFNKTDCNANSTNLKTKVDDKDGKQRTNVIYLNTDCNLRCEYCYEGNSRNGLPDQAKCTTKDIDIFLNEICQRENKCVSTIVIMGGEPFLNFDMIEYTILKAASLSKNKQNGWGISLISNGTLFTNKILTRFKEILNLASKHQVNVSLEVSFDGSGQYRRKWPDGSNSKKQVEKGIQKLIDFEIPFKLSYVVHSGNYKNIVKDCIYVFEKYPLPYNYRMTVGFAYEDLDSVLGPNGAHKLKNEFKPYAYYLFDLYKVPICGITCGYCKNCNQSNFVGNSYLSPTTGISYDNKLTEHSFQQF